MMNIVLVVLVAIETIGLAILWNRYNQMRALLIDTIETEMMREELELMEAMIAERELEELMAELDKQIEEEQNYEETIEEEIEDYDDFRYNYKAVLKADIEVINERMAQALEEADFDTYDELEKDLDSYIEELKFYEQYRQLASLE